MLPVSSQQAGTSRIIQDDIGTDEAVAGPSRINRRQQLVSSTPNIQSTATHLLAGTERKMNGMKVPFIIDIFYHFEKVLMCLKTVSVKFHCKYLSCMIICSTNACKCSIVWSYVVQ
jgi:hypothetical protein